MPLYSINCPEVGEDIEKLARLFSGIFVGRSVVVSVLNVGVVLEPVDGPEKNVFAVCEFNDNASVPEATIGDPEIDKIEGTVIDTEVTVPAFGVTHCVLFPVEENICPVVPFEFVESYTELVI